MGLAALALTLITSSTPGVYFHLEGATLWRAEVVPGAAAGQSGLVPATVRAHHAVRLPGLVMAFEVDGSRAVAVVCRRSLARTDVAQACPLFLVRADGSAQALGVDGLWGALTPGARVLFLGDDLVLRRRALEGGAVEVLARHVLEPRLSVDGTHVGLAHSPGLEALAPGFDACPAVLSLATGELAREPGPCAAQAPFLGPRGARLNVSTTSGLAALYSGTRQLSARSEADFVPVPDRELAWLDATSALYAARYERDELVLFDLERGVARTLGRGHGPAWVQDGAGARGLFAFDGRAVVELGLEEAAR